MLDLSVMDLVVLGVAAGLAVALLLLVACLFIPVRRGRREAHALAVEVASLGAALSATRSDLTAKLDELSEAQRAAVERESSGAQTSTELTEGHLERFAEVGEAWRSAAEAVQAQREAQAEALVGHSDAQRELLDTQAAQIRRLGEMLQSQIERLGELGSEQFASGREVLDGEAEKITRLGEALDAQVTRLVSLATAWVKMAAGVEACDERRTRMMSEHAEALRSMARSLAQLESHRIVPATFAPPYWPGYGVPSYPNAGPPPAQPPRDPESPSDG